MGLGPVHTVSLAEAREAAQEARKAVLAGNDPIQQRQAARAVVIPTFRETAKAFMEAHRSGWRNAKHAEQWEVTLDEYAHPLIGDRRVDHIELDDILEILTPIWSKKTETATRLRQRMERILDWSAVRKQRSSENPARWKGYLDKLLPNPEKVRKRRNFPAMPYAQVPAFMAELRQRKGQDARALEFTILTAVRTSMTVFARQQEIQGNIWTIPAERMKAGKEHVVPLTEAAIRALPPISSTPAAIYPGRGKRPFMSTNTMDALLERMGYSQFTVHGFRSSFKDWAVETTHFPNIVSEAVLSHTIKDKTEAAYRRGDLLQKRRELMQAWADYLKEPKPQTPA